MAKTLLLLRHAKSSWSDPTLEDFDRPLSKRGRKAAPAMGGYLGKQDLIPALTLCSAAQRTVETWSLVAEVLSGYGGLPIPTRYLRSLYLAPPSRVLATLRRTPDEVDRLLVIGHNPETEHLAIRLGGGGSDPQSLARMEIKFPTAALAVLRFEEDGWPDVAPGSGRLVGFVTPKDLSP